ncbi:2Fe-2S iron-sulfur cluster-binding protein (plasmid) [Arthrobacter sp. D3-18]
MGKITFHHSSGAVDVLDVQPGTTVMRAAVTNGVAGIVGECGGQAMCATCHIYVREQYLDSLPSVSVDEDEMLDCTTAQRVDRSRLGCQLTIGDGIEEIEVDVPESQI